MVALQWSWRATCYLRCTTATDDPRAPLTIFQQEVSPFTSTGVHTPYATLRNMISDVSHIVCHQDSAPQFTLSADRRVISFRGTPISVTSYIQFVQDSVSEAESLTTALLEGCSIATLDNIITDALRVSNSASWFRDALREDKAGYSFLDPPASTLSDYKDTLIRHMLRGSETAYSVPHPDVAGGEIFNRVSCCAWLSRLDTLVEQLFVATVFTWPGAARGTEVTALKYRNQHSCRNVYFINGMITFLCDYNKNTHIDGTGSLIPRTVPPRVGRLFIILFAVFYPCATYLATALKMDEAAEAYMMYAFVHRRQALDSEAMTKILESRTQHGLQCALGLRDMRQIVIYFMKHTLRTVLEEHREGIVLDLLHDLCGHSARTAEQRYGVDVASIQEVSTDTVHRSQQLAMAYHQHLGLGYADVPTLPRGQNNEILFPSSAVTQGMFTRNDIDHAVQEAISQCLPRVADALNTTISQSMSYYHPQAGNPTRAIWHPPSQSVVVHPRALNAVKLLYGTSTPAFSTPEQGSALELILQGQHHVFCVLPTGGGKSLLFYGPPLVEPSGITVVSALWPSLPTDVFSLRLVIVPAHFLNDTTLLTWLNSTRANGLLRRLIFDEAHEILTSSRYRRCYALIPKLAGLGVPLHFLTATILRNSVRALIQQVGIDLAHVRFIAASTIRPNLQYNVVDHREASFHQPGSIYDRLQTEFELAQPSRAGGWG
ncbi:hypothetical protein ONZ45_g18730 [Pleurotus djamor]|nr:hypothetical protein ONZ45_g18730 [Pleurotus djamor]